MNNIVRKPNVWDLHIHTPLGTPQKQNYGGISNAEFVEKLISIYNNSSFEIGMISFTDHNKINSEAYKIFQDKSEIAIIPGIEMDIWLSSDSKDSKHIIFYFPEKWLIEIDTLKFVIEDFISKKSKVVFEEFVLYLASKKINFAISPHAFKQRKRGINYEWGDEQSAMIGTNKFCGLFFPFWEAGGETDIAKAIEFLKDQEEYNREIEQAVIAFSDSADFEKIKSFIDHPHQFFLCLNSFKGLLLAGTDLSRIIYEWEERPINPSEKIKQIEISTDLKKKTNENKEVIEFSDRLNVIIGGRGKGKSSLLDALVYGLSPMRIEQSKRRSFVQKFCPTILNYNDYAISSNLNFVYYSQANITKIFDGDRNEELTNFFDSEFSKNISLLLNLDEIKTSLNNLIIPLSIDRDNIDDDFRKLLVIKDEKVQLAIRKREFDSVPLNIDGMGFDTAIKQYLDFDDDFWDDKTNKALLEFTKSLLHRAVEINKEDFFNKQFSNMLLKKINEEKSKLSKQNRDKVAAQKKIKKKLKAIYQKELSRVYHINNLYSIECAMTRLKIKYVYSQGEENNKFYFVTIVNEEHPIEYAKRILIESIDKRSVPNISSMRAEELFKLYAFTTTIDEKLKDSISVDRINTKFKNLDGIKAEKINKVIYYQGEEFVDLHLASPGTQTNAVMEYIFHSDATSPIIIDQPEDNIDNEARYSKLTKWIKKQKYKRQIILVTHDANIVINGDAECVIVANYDGNTFTYKYGALESENVLDDAARILDGGKRAIKRRMDKYGE